MAKGGVMTEKNNLQKEHIMRHGPEIGISFLSNGFDNCVSHPGDSTKPDSFILIVDDEDSMITMIHDALVSIGYPTKSASNACKALDIVKNENISLIISDIRMEKIDGIEFMREVHKHYPDIPFIIMTGYTPNYSYEDIINAGASDFIEKPFSIGELKAKISRIENEKHNNKKIQQALVMIRKLFKNTVRALTSTLEIRDPYTAGHQVRVAELACAIGQNLGFEKERIEVLCLASMIHDIGKIGVPSAILAKPGKLNEHELNMVRYHSQIGFDILQNIEFPWPIDKMVFQHHERIDGAGYPQRLAGEEILLEARIIGVADVVEAMSSHRPYRAALGIEKALEEIMNNKGKLYDPQVVDECVRLFTEKNFTFG